MTGELAPPLALILAKINSGLEMHFLFISISFHFYKLFISLLAFDVGKIEVRGRDEKSLEMN